MPIIQNNKIYPLVYHGGAIDLDTLSRQKIRVTIRFPYRQNGSKWDLDPLTVNLLSDIGVSGNSRVYAVNWGDALDTKITMSNGMFVAKHQHTYRPGSGNDSYTKTYDIIIYGDDLLKFRGFKKSVGQAPSGFDITCELVEQNLTMLRRFIPAGVGDMLLKSGARINRAFWGKHLVYSKDIQGSTLQAVIRLNGSNEVRLVNPLISDMNEWENVRTDLEIDWGDGTKTQWFNRRVNSGLFNSGSKYIPKHTYKGNTGDKFTITIKGVEPLLPIYCDVLELDGEFPEDKYNGNPDGLLTYTDNTVNDYRTELSKIKSTCYRVGASLLSNWVKTDTMINMFRGWTALLEIPVGFIGENIRTTCKNYLSAFDSCTSLKKVDPNIIGETNNVVEEISMMFKNTPALTETIRLVTANKLRLAYAVYHMSGVTRSRDFLTTVPILEDVRQLFDGSGLSNYDTTLLKTSPSIKDASKVMFNTPITEIHINMTQWHQIRSLEYAYAGTKLANIKAGVFGGNFAKDTAENDLKMGHIFDSIGTNDAYCEVSQKAFTDLGKVSNKLYYVQPAWLAGAKINKLYDGLFDGVFSGTTPRFNIIQLLHNIKTKDQFGYEYDCIYVPEILRNCTGVRIADQLLSFTTIGYISSKFMYGMPNVEVVNKMLATCKIHTRFPEKFFYNNKKISDWSNLFLDTEFKYPEVPIDDIIWSEVDSVNVDNMLKGKTNIACYRLFGYSSTVKTVVGTKLFGYTPSLPHTKIFRGRTHTMSDTVEIKPLIYVLNFARDKGARFSRDDGATGACLGKISIDGADYIDVDFSTYSYQGTAGSHVIKIICSEAITIRQQPRFWNIAYIGGEFPYNSKPVQSVMFPREVDRYVYAICDHNYVHTNSKLAGFDIYHKDVFKYHDEITETNVFNTTRSVYAFQPRILEHMRNLTKLDYILNNRCRVVSDLFLPKELNKTTALDGSKLVVEPGKANTILTNIYVQRHAFDQKNYTIDNPSLGKMQVNTPDNSYLEFRLQSINGALGFKLLDSEPTYPIIVETLHKGDIKPSKHVLNSISDTITTSGETFVRIFSDKPVWINDANKNNITEIFGCIPECNFTWKMKDLAPNLKRIGELLFIYCTNDSFIGTFKGLQHFEYFPGTLFWYNYKATDYESCFEDCPTLFKVDDYIITDKVGDINCRNMFKNSGVTNVRRPIMDDVNGKVVVDGMFGGCKTDFWYGHTDIDSIMFKNIDTFGKSGIIFSGNNNQPTDNWYCATDMSNEALCNISYQFESSRVPLYTKFASQAISSGAVIPIEDINKINTKYLPFVTNIGFGYGVRNNAYTGKLPEDYFMYMERLGETYTAYYLENVEWNKSAYYRCNDIESLMDMRDNNNGYYNTYVNTSIQDVVPYNCKALRNAEYAFLDAKGLTIPSDYKLPEHCLVAVDNMFRGSDLHVPYGFFDNVRKDGVIVGSDPMWTVEMNSVFEDAKGLVEETGIFRSYGRLADPDAIKVYNNSSLRTLQPDKVYEGCEHLEVLDYHFSNCPNLSTLPKINHLTNVWSYQHMFERSNILEIPANYLYTTRDDKDIMLDYMFANNQELFFTEVWIDGRCPGYFSIDYSLNEVFSGIGDDPEIFGHIQYDDDYDHRSRVYPFDTRVTWIQMIEVVQPNTTVKLEGLYNKNLVGFDPEQIFAVMWGDTKQATVVRDGLLLEEKHITHTYVTPGTYELRVMLRNDCCYLPTPESGESKIRTVDLPTSFKFGNVTDIRDKGLCNMFGTGVKHVSRDLFTKLTGIESIQVYNNMFTKFKNLTDLEVGVLDCMPNLTTMKDFLYDSKGNVELTLKAGLLDKLTKLIDVENFAFRSNVRTVEPHIFDKNIVLDSMLYGFTESKITELPRDLLSKLTVLNNVGRLVAWCSNFELDESYSNFFANNKNIEWASGAFMGTKINAIPTSIMKPMINLINGAEMFATDQQLVSSEPWTDGKLDVNDLHIPSGFLSANTKLQEASNMFAGRKSLKDYPANLLSTNKALNNTRCMFTQTGISRIHEGTFNGFTTNIDAEYMFYGCRVRLCPKPIINSTGTFKTLGMLYRVSGLMTEDELFDGVKTDPTDIQSMYRQELEYYVMDGTFNGNMYLKAIEPSTFPWDGYTLDIDPGDGNVVTIEADMPNQDKLAELTRFTPKGSTIKVKAPFAIELAGGTATYTRLSGVFGRMATTTHILMKNTGYKSSKFTIDDDNFYKRNTHLTNLTEAFGSTNVEYIRTNSFKYLSKVTNISNMCYGCTQFKIKSGYTPNFDHMKLVDISQAYEACAGLVINKDWEPFKNIPTIVRAVNVLARTGIITTPYINTTSLTEAQGMYWTCPNLTTTYADILNGASKCWNYYGVFGNSPKLSIIEGESDTHSIGDTAITGVTGSVDYEQMFTNTGLSQQQIVRIVNNLGVWKVNTQLSVNTTNMFTDMLIVGSSGAKPRIKINGNNKNIDAERMFCNARLTNVPNQAIVLTGNSGLNYKSMFYNCFADPSVEILNDVFNIPGQTETTDFRSSDLDTLNVFRISVTPEQVTRVMSSSNISTASLVDDISEIPTSNNSTNISDNIISDNIDKKQINSTNVSDEIIVDNIEEEIK